MEAAPFNHAAALIACSKGDEAAFYRFFEHEAPHMLALCQRLFPSDPEGLLHDALTLIWRNADQYDVSMGPARPWIYSVLRHVANGRRMRENKVEPQAAPPVPPASSIRGRISMLAQDQDTTAYEALAHAYLHGADYRRVATWMRRDETELRNDVRAGLKELKV